MDKLVKRDIVIPEGIKRELQDFNSGSISGLSDEVLLFTAIKIYGCNFGYFNGKVYYSGGRIFDNDYKNRQLKIPGVENAYA